MIVRAVEILRSGGLVAFPTETVYGLGADATNPKAVSRIFAAKGRPSTNPLIAHVASAEVARRYVSRWTEAADKLAAAFWPGPLTIVLPKQPVIASNVTAGLSSVGIRVPNHPLALELLAAFDGAVAAPSANRSNRVSPTTAQHVHDELGESVDLILDGGSCTVGIESTVLDLTADVPCILRPGGVSKAQLEQVLGTVHEGSGAVAGSEPSKSPGQQVVHYSPRTPTRRFTAAQRDRVPSETSSGKPYAILLLGPQASPKREGATIFMPNDPAAYARHLYQVLRDLDTRSLHTIYIEMPPPLPEWAAVRDRLLRATIAL